MDLRRLREQTRKEHEATESALPLMAPGLTLETYAATLCSMLPIIEGWETWSEEHAPERVRPLLLARRRSHLLRRDLLDLEIEMPAATGKRVDWPAIIPAGQRLHATAPDDFEAGFMGAFYVMEGSTLGGRFVARHVESALGLQPGRGDAYFQGHGDETAALWRETTAAIAAIPETKSDCVIAAAKRTFEAFGAALRSGAPDVCTSMVTG